MQRKVSGSRLFIKHEIPQSSDQGLFLYCSIYKEVEEITENWVKQFNEERPHESLGNLTPMEYLAVNQ